MPSARTWSYRLVDVFTTEPFGGNPLAVFPEAAGLAPELMQLVAREIGYSETTFVLPPQDPSCDVRVRIFTPARELPMAGHPTVGTAHVLAREGRLGPGSSPAGSEPGAGQTLLQVRFEEGVGAVPVEIELLAGTPGLIRMEQPRPRFGPIFEDRRAAAEMLGLGEEDLLSGLPLEVVSSGVPFLFVPLRNLEAVAAARLRLDLWEKLLGGFAATEVFVFCLGGMTERGSVHSRMFAPALGITEDPATGGASGPLGAYCVRHGLIRPDAAGRARLTSEQGFEIARPSFIEIAVDTEGEAITRLEVGGECVSMGGGQIAVPDRPPCQIV